MELRERLESVFEERALPRVEEAKLQKMSLAEVLYHALVEAGDDRRWRARDAVMDA